VISLILPFHTISDLNGPANRHIASVAIGTVFLSRPQFMQVAIRATLLFTAQLDKATVKLQTQRQRDTHKRLHSKHI